MVARIVYEDRRGNTYERIVEDEMNICRHLKRLLSNRCKILLLEKEK